MRRWTTIVLALLAVTSAASREARAQTGAKTNGNWNDPTTWTTGTVPGSSTSVYIGSTSPSGSATTATVALTQAQSASNVFLGYGSGTSGTLDLGSNALTISGSLSLGTVYGGTGVIQEATVGSFSAHTVYVNGSNALTFGANDVTSSLSLLGGSATTTAGGNVTGDADIYSGSALHMGADQNLGNATLNVEDKGSVLDMGGHAITAGSIELASGGSAPVTVLNQGNVTAIDFYVGNGMTYNLLAGDKAGSLFLSNGATGSTVSATNLTDSAYVNSGSTLNLGSDTTLRGGLEAEDKGVTLNMNGHALTATLFELGYNSSYGTNLLNRGAIAAPTLEVGNTTFDLAAVDKVTNFQLNNATSTLHGSVSDLFLENGSVATTTASGNVTSYASVTSGSTLHLGADLNLGTNGSLYVLDKGSVLDMGGHSITAGTVELGDGGSAPVTVENQGNITSTYLYVGNGMTYNLLAGDKVGSFDLTGGSSSVLNGTVSSLDLANGSTASTTAGTPMALSSVSLDQESMLRLHGGDAITNSISLTNDSVLIVQETNGTGLTFDGTSSGSLTIDPSHMDLNFTSTGWDFRWQDPSNGGNWISTIDALIASGSIDINLPSGGTYQVVDQGGYTYINGFVTPASVPEPSSLVLAAMAIGGVAIGSRWRRSRPRR